MNRDSTHSGRSHRRLHLLLAAAWAAVWLGGTAIFVAYERASGERGPTPQSWPAGCAIGRFTDQITMVVFVHPRCPCTRATLAELAATLTRSHSTADVVAVLVEPSGASSDWSQGAAARILAVLPTARIHHDCAGREAQRFGVLTSGQIAVYDRLGRLRFSGGLTPARGQQGVNAGQLAIAALLAGRAPSAACSDVFGCPLFDAPPGEEGR